MSDYYMSLDTELKDVLNYLKSRPEICDLNIQEILPASSTILNDWEIKNTCMIPQDMKSFYQSRNGINIDWKYKIDNDVTIPLGKMSINGINDLTKIGSVLQKDFKDPSIFDLEELQECDNCSCIPHFDDRSRNFEVDSCNGFGKVCLVYRNTRSGITADNAEFWFLDRSLRWHFLAQSFTNYYRLLVSHLGLPQWQMLFTEDGLPSFLHHWYYMLTPGRILVHEDNMKILIDSKKSKQNFDANKVFKEKDTQKKPNQNQVTKTSSATNYNSNVLNTKRKSLK